MLTCRPVRNEPETDQNKVDKKSNSNSEEKEYKERDETKIWRQSPLRWSPRSSVPINRALGASEGYKESRYRMAANTTLWTLV